MQLYIKLILCHTIQLNYLKTIKNKVYLKVKCFFNFKTPFLPQTFPACVLICAAQTPCYTPPPPACLRVLPPECESFVWFLSKGEQNGLACEAGNQHIWLQFKNFQSQTLQFQQEEGMNRLIEILSEGGRRKLNNPSALLLRTKIISKRFSFLRCWALKRCSPAKIEVFFGEGCLWELLSMFAVNQILQHVCWILIKVFLLCHAPWCPSHFTWLCTAGRFSWHCLPWFEFCRSFLKVD